MAAGDIIRLDDGHYRSDHPPVDADFDSPPGEGAMCVDTEGQHLYFKQKGSWVQYI
jgi:hypothetical protein